MTQPTNTVETADDAARRFAGQLERLRIGLEERGIAPVSSSVVTTALVEIDELRAANEGTDLTTAGLTAEQEIRARALDLAVHHAISKDVYATAERFAAYITDGTTP